MPESTNEWIAFIACILYVAQWILILWLYGKANSQDDDHA